QKQSPTVDVPTAVQNLLQSTKRLQDVLRQWSVAQASESQVSDVYVLVGNEFNTTITAFARHNIDMSEIYSVPRELRGILEHCLGEEPSPQVLESFMPQVRQTLFNLLEGLKSKQAEYWRAVGRA
ncbi:hypothetical protein JAAARDRAFT_140943, partial [Jaapia argillacea MUCL 33604]